MGSPLGQLVAHHWPWLLVAWAVLLAGLCAVAPPWRDVVRDGEFSFLPEDVPSLVGQRLYEQAFERDLQGSSIVVVARRVNEPLRPTDWAYVDRVLGPWLEVIAVQARSQPAVMALEPIRVRTFHTGPIGELLDSEDGHATLVMVELPAGLPEPAARQLVGTIEHKLQDLHTIDSRRQRIPAGLHVSVTGTAAVARDMHRAAQASAAAIEWWCIILVGLLLVMLFRAPLLALIPVVTAAVAWQIALSGQALLAQAGVIGLFAGIETHITVIISATCGAAALFLTERYREELDGGATLQEGIARAIEKSSPVLWTGLATAGAGLGVLVAARFGKFRELGVALPLAIIVGCLAAVTIAPALLLAVRQWAFWPYVRRERIADAAGWLSPSRLTTRWSGPAAGRDLWRRLGRLLAARPAAVGLTAAAVLLPLALLGTAWNDRLSYGSLAELPPDAPSRAGTTALTDHFAAGEAGPVTLLLHTPGFDYRTNEGIDAVEVLTRRLAARRDELGLADIRSLSHPLGLGQPTIWEQSIFLIRWCKRRAFENYVSDRGPLAGQATRVDFVFRDDPFTRAGTERLQQLEHTIHDLLAAEGNRTDETDVPAVMAESQLSFIGATAGIRDLRTVTRRDQVRTGLLAVLGVFLVLALRLRRPAMAAGLAGMLLLAALAALGLTFLVARLFDPSAGGALNWELPVLLLPILMGLGAGYDGEWLARLTDEQARRGPHRGVSVAVSRTGGTMAHGGLVMTAALAALLAGSLVGLRQLGFALAVGMLFETLLVRSALIPAYLVLMQTGRLGLVSRWLTPSSPPTLRRPVPVARQLDYEPTEN